MFSDDTEEIEGEAECKEDKLVDEFLKLIISEIVIRYGLSYLIEFPWKFFESLCAGDDFEWKDDFALGDEVVWLFTVELEFWMCQILYPAISVIGAIFMTLHCKYLIIRLRYQKKQPTASSNDKATGALLNKYLSLTFLTVVAFYAMILFFKMPRFKYYVIDGEVYDNDWWCGPFTSNNELSPIEEVGLFPGPDAAINRFVYCFLLQFSVYTLLYIQGYNAQSHV